ncbi:MAG: cytochrome b [Betaproteobacteria bacterium]|nr:cytochrome b [Betaproteobacteria bacterium]
MTDGHPRYGALAISLHWLVFALVVAAWALGLYMVDLPLSPQKLKYFSWHKWIGATIFLVAGFRAAWRLAHPAPPPPVTMPHWQHGVAGASHLLLYVLILVIPVTGWLYSSATGVPTVYLGWVQLPDLVGKDKVLAEFLKELHVSFNWMLFILVCMHATQALKHHFFDRDDVLMRMAPFLAKRSGRR